MNIHLTKKAARRGTPRLTGSISGLDRRAFMRLAAAQGVAAPVALAAFDGGAEAAELPVPRRTRSADGRKGSMRLAAIKDEDSEAASIIVRDFTDPHLELLRLLREASEIEHALMLQYLYGAFSLRESYEELAGFGDATSDNLIGVAIQEMQHLGAVNRLLVALGSCPHLERQDMPYEPDIYPFAFELEPLSRASIAKYIYAEAPASVFDPSLATDAEGQAFRESVIALICADRQKNHIGSLYRTILDLLDEVKELPDSPISVDEAARWHEELKRIMDEGEDDHFVFFRNVFEGEHEAFGADHHAWSRDTNDPFYPVHTAVGSNPTAYIGHQGQIEEPGGLILGWLGDLHYWLTLSTLDYAYRTDDPDALSLAIGQMLSTVWPIAKALPTHDAGMPFDPLSMGYSLGIGPGQCKRLVARFCIETLNFQEHAAHRLPDTYDPSAPQELVQFMTA